MTNLAFIGQSQVDTDLRQLRGFTGPGFTADDNNLVITDNLPEIIAFFIKRQFAVQ